MDVKRHSEHLFFARLAEETVASIFSVWLLAHQDTSKTQEAGGPLLFVLSLLVLGLAGLLWKPFWIVLVVESTLYLLALAIGALDVGRKSGWRYAPLAPAIFAILHFAYGFGSLWGVVRFSVLKHRGVIKPEAVQMSR